MSETVATAKFVAKGVAFAIFFSALFFAGYVNEELKPIIADWKRALLLLGFIVGAGAASVRAAKAVSKTRIGERR